VFLGARAGSDTGRTVSYHGERYTRAAVATEEHVKVAGVVATGDKLDGQDVYAERRTPSRVLFLLRPDGEYDAFVLVDES
jgi:hypothetical protein